MNRVILTPAVLPGSALSELKLWLAITTDADDAPLAALLDAALEACEAFTGQVLLEMTCEELLPGCSGWHALSAHPVQAIEAVAGVADDGTRFAIAADAYEIDLEADGTGRVRLPSFGDEARVAVRFTAGLAAEWDDLPPGLRHGVIRHAAHQHRARESDAAGGDAAPQPPAAVAALWRPWRRLRLR